MAFLNSKNMTEIPTDKVILDGILKELWPSLRTIKGEPYRASSLINLRNILRIVIQEKISVDIITDTALSTQNVVFQNYLHTLKKKGYGSISHHKEVTKEDLHTIVHSLDPLSPRELQWLSWIFIQLHFCRRGFENVTDMKKQDLIVEKFGTFTIIRVKNELTKNHREVNEDAESGGRISSVPGNSKCPVKIIESYLDKLNPNCSSLWQKPKKNVSTSNPLWYDAVPLGHNSLATIMKNISTFCGLQTIYTNHCLRVSACSFLGDAGFTDLNVLSVSKHKSVSALGVYKRVKTDRKIEMSQSLSNAIGILPANDTSSSTCVDLGCSSHQNCCISYGANDQAPIPHEASDFGAIMPNEESRSEVAMPTKSQLIMPPESNPECMEFQLGDEEWKSMMELIEATDNPNINSSIAQRASLITGKNVVVLNNCNNLTLNFN
jgi:hypothetical protein